MIARVTLLMLAGCSFTQGDLGGASGDAKRDGNGDGSPIRIDGSPDFDYDEDGFSDAVDNCMTITNTDQRDWDGDHVGDACDWCPHIASTANADGDGDMVGDLCDPRPAIAGDALALWTSFHDAGQITGWYSGGTGGIGVWSVSGMALAQSATDPLDFTSWASPNLYQRTYLATSFVLGTPNALATVGVCSGWDGSSFDCCNINTRKGAAVAEAQSGGPMQSMPRGLQE